MQWPGLERRLQASGAYVTTGLGLTSAAGRVVAKHESKGVHRIAYDEGGMEIADLSRISYQTLSGGPPAANPAYPTAPSSSQAGSGGSGGSGGTNKAVEYPVIDGTYTNGRWYVPQTQAQKNQQGKGDE